jgi:hypothetical protein
MEIALTAESASRIRAVLGDAVDLSPAAVPEVLARLAAEAPDVYSEILSQLSGSDIRLDSERALHRRHRRLTLRRALFGWGEYESDAGDRLLAKRRVAASVPVALAIVLLSLAGLSALLNASRRTVTPAAARVPPSSATAPSVRTAVIRLSALRVAPAQAGPGTPPEATRRGSFVRLPPVPGLSIPPSLSGFAAVTPPSSIVFTSTPASADTVPRSAIVYARDLGADTDDAPAQHAAPFGASGGSHPGTPRRVGDRIAARLVTGIVVATGVPSVPVVAEATDGSTWLGRAQAEADGRVHILFEAADRHGAGSFAVPQPTLRAATNGVALEPDRLSAGLPGRIVVRRRTAAAAAIGAIVQAVSDYLQAVAHAGQVTVAEGTTQVSIGGPAPGWTYAASRLADALNPQAAGATIETLEVSAGTRCIILITEVP